MIRSSIDHMICSLMCIYDEIYMIDKFFSSVIFKELDRDIEQFNEKRIIEQPKCIDYSNSNRIREKSESNEHSISLNICAFSPIRFALLIIKKNIINNNKTPQV